MTARSSSHKYEEGVVKVEKLSNLQVDKQSGTMTASETFTIEGPANSATNIGLLTKQLMAVEMPQWIGGNLVTASNGSTHQQKHKCIKIIHQIFWTIVTVVCLSLMAITSLSFGCDSQSQRIAGLISLSIPILYLLLTCLYQILNPCCSSRTRTGKRLLLTWILALMTLALKLITILANIYVFNEMGLLESIKDCKFNYGPISSVIFSYFMIMCVFPICTTCSKQLL